MRKFYSVIITLSVALFLAACSKRCEVVFEGNMAMKTRDGVTLRADIYRPKGIGKYPVILTRTPYNKYMNVDQGLKLAARGYVFIAQDVRGREASEGEWYPFKHEADDGYDAVEWAASLPFSNGKVGMIGGSYVGITQLYAAMAAPPHLVAIVPHVAPSDIHGQLVYQGGAFMQILAQAWSSAVALNEHTHAIFGTANPFHWDLKLPPAEYPILDLGDARKLAPYYRDWIAHPAYDDYWKQLSFEEYYGKITVPVLHLGGWYDVFQGGTIRNYLGIKQRGGSEAARKGQRFIIEPGGHAGSGPKIGEVDFGKNSRFSTWDYGLRWLDWQLKGIDDGISREKPVKIFVMGENVWRDEEEWPLARAVTTKYYLRSGGKANSLKGDGGLSREAPVDEPADKFISDPANPVPNHGGATLGLPNPPPGPLDQREVEAREDVLVYTTPAFDKPMEVTGPVSLELYVSSSAVDTDIVGKLVDVAPDGRAIILTENILRMRYRNSYEKAELMNPGQTYQVTLDLWSTANVFLAGHKIRLEVSSGSFPRFDRNPNHGGSPEAFGEAVKATNVILHDREHPSALVVPIVPR